MLHLIFALAALALPGAAAAQGFSAPALPSTVDATARGAAAAAQAKADAAVSAMPLPATSPPRSETIGAAIGTTSTRYALEDHQHPRLTSTTYATLDGTCQASVPFSRTFVNKPGLNLTETDAVTGAQPLVLRGLAWQRDGNGLYTGVTIQGRRAQMLPTLNPLSGAVTLVSGVVTGVNGLVSSLTMYDVFGGACGGATISVIAVARSDMPSN